MAGEAGVLAADVLLGVFGGTSSLRASSNALVGVIGLVIAGAGNLVALRNAATVSASAWVESVK